MRRGEQAFQKALLLLDRRRFDDGRRSLESAIELAQAEDDELTRLRACCCLGELLAELGQPTLAVDLLRTVTEAKRDDDLLDHEIEAARELLEHLDPS